MRQVELSKLFFFFIKLLIFNTAIVQVSSAQRNLGDLTKLAYAELDKVANECYDKGNYAFAIPYMEAGLQKSEAEFGKKDSVYAHYAEELGTFYYYLGQYDKTIGLFGNALEIYKEKFGKEHGLYTTALSNLAHLYQAIGRFAEAEEMFKEGLNINKKIKGDNHPAYAADLNNLASLYYELGRYEEAELLYLKNIKIIKNTLGKDHPHYGKSLNNLASLYNKMHNYSEAEPLFLEAKEIKKKAMGEQHPSYAQTLNNLGLLYEEMGRYKESEQLHAQANQIYKQALGEKHPAYAQSLNNLAILYSSLKRYEDSEKLQVAAKDIWKQTLGVNHPAYAGALNNLATLYRNMNRYADMEALLLESINIKQQTLGERHPEYAGSLNSLAKLYSMIDKDEQAWIYLRQALFVLTGLEMSQNINKNWADSLRNVTTYSSADLMQLDETLAGIYMLLSKTPNEVNKGRRIIIVELAVELLKRSRDSYSGASDKLRTLSATSEWVLFGFESLNKNTQADLAFKLAEQGKSVLLMEAVKMERAYSFGELPDNLVKEEQNLQKQHAKLEANLIENRPKQELDSLNGVLNELNLTIKKFRTDIEQKYPAYAALKYKEHNINVQEVQALLDDKTAMLEYVVGDSTVYVFCIDKQGVKLLECPVTPSQLKTNVKALHQALSDYQYIVKKPEEAYQQYTRTAFWFYKNLVQPGLAHVKNIEHLIIVTDGELGHLPFETFLTKEASQTLTSYSELQYLVQKYRVSYNYSASLFVENQTQSFDKLRTSKTNRKNNGQLLVMASNYDPKIDSTMLDLRLPVYQRLRNSLNPLPNARKEAMMLADNFQSFLCLDGAATERTFKEKAADFGIIHLAMHGLLDSEAPTLSSLAFTEDKDSVENNFLQAYEISKTKLNADLVVLSACETGYGKFEKGNGIASLARAFMYAGASALVVSLWQVNDFATAELMKIFYNNLTAGMSKDEALQQAKLQYIAKAEGVAAHPAFWSPFILIGNESPIVISKKGGYLWWAIGGLGVVVVLGVGVLALRRKKE